MNWTNYLIGQGFTAGVVLIFLVFVRWTIDRRHRRVMAEIDRAAATRRERYEEDCRRREAERATRMADYEARMDRRIDSPMDGLDDEPARPQAASPQPG